MLHNEFGSQTVYEVFAITLLNKLNINQYKCVNAPYPPNKKENKTIKIQNGVWSCANQSKLYIARYNVTLADARNLMAIFQT